MPSFGRDTQTNHQKGQWHYRSSHRKCKVPSKPRAPGVQNKERYFAKNDRDAEWVKRKKIAIEIER